MVLSISSGKPRAVSVGEICLLYSIGIMKVDQANFARRSVHQLYKICLLSKGYIIDKSGMRSATSKE